jgi:hypothetical protein
VEIGSFCGITTAPRSSAAAYRGFPRMRKWLLPQEIDLACAAIRKATYFFGAAVA